MIAARQEKTRCIAQIAHYRIRYAFPGRTTYTAGSFALSVLTVGGISFGRRLTREDVRPLLNIVTLLPHARSSLGLPLNSPESTSRALALQSQDSTLSNPVKISRRPLLVNRPRLLSVELSPAIKRTRLFRGTSRLIHCTALRNASYIGDSHTAFPLVPSRPHAIARAGCLRLQGLADQDVLMNGISEFDYDRIYLAYEVGVLDQGDPQVRIVLAAMVFARQTTSALSQAARIPLTIFCSRALAAWLGSTTDGWVWARAPP